MEEYGFGDVIPDPKRPGPDYYKDCVKFNWATKLIESHKKHIEYSGKYDVYKIEFTAEELAIIQKLKEGSAVNMLSATLAMGLVFTSLIWYLQIDLILLKIINLKFIVKTFAH